jgi:riboflavin biosynthesis pyrimidine reductase
MRSSSNQRKPVIVVVDSVGEAAMRQHVVRDAHEA